MNAKQPNSRHCFVCGLENPYGLKLSFYDAEPGVVHSTWVAGEQFQGYPGIVHGGVIAAVLDEAATRTVFGPAGSNRLVVTASLEIRYRKPVPLNTELSVTGKIKEDKGEIIYATSKIEDGQGQVLANASAVMVVVSPQVAAGMALTGEEWKVYPDGEAE